MAEAPPTGSFNNPFTMGGILEDPTQLNQLAGNPLFNIGMGLLAHRQDKNVNPFLNAMKGVAASGESQRTQDSESRDQQLRDMLAEFFAKQGQVPGQAPRVDQFGGQPGMTGPPGRDYGMGEQQQGPPGRDYYQYGWGDILGG